MVRIVHAGNGKTMGIMAVYLHAKQNELFSLVATAQPIKVSRHEHTCNGSSGQKIYLAFSKMHHKSSGCNCVQLLVSMYVIWIFWPMFACAVHVDVVRYLPRNEAPLRRGWNARMDEIRDFLLCTEQPRVEWNEKEDE